MNSKQRRKDKRLWKYTVKMTYRDYDHYDEMWNWLKARYGSKVCKCGWRDRHAWNPADEYDVVWEFTDEKKYIEFMLRWV